MVTLKALQKFPGSRWLLAPWKNECGVPAWEERKK